MIYFFHAIFFSSSISYFKYIFFSFSWSSMLCCIQILYQAACVKLESYYNSSSVCLFVCLCVPYLLRGPLTDLRQTWWVYVGGPPICPWGVLFQKGQRVNGSLSLSTILYMYQPHATQLQRRLLLARSAAESNSAPFAAASQRHMQVDLANAIERFFF